MLCLLFVEAARRLSKKSIERLHQHVSVWATAAESQRSAAAVLATSVMLALLATALLHGVRTLCFYVPSKLRARPEGFQDALEVLMP